MVVLVLQMRSARIRSTCCSTSTGPEPLLALLARKNRCRNVGARQPKVLPAIRPQKTTRYQSRSFQLDYTITTCQATESDASSCGIYSFRPVEYAILLTIQSGQAETFLLCGIAGSVAGGAAVEGSSQPAGASPGAGKLAGSRRAANGSCTTGRSPKLHGRPRGCTQPRYVSTCCIELDLFPGFGTFSCPTASTA